MVEPLEPNTTLADRFMIREVLGRGGFSIVYLADDLRRGDQAVLKELVPAAAQRGQGGMLDLGPNAASLRRAFLAEAQTLGRLSIAGILPVRLTFGALGTAYVATDAVIGARTLDEQLKEEGPLDPDGLLDLAFQLMETLEAVHRRGLLHRDIKPSNVLIGPDGRAYLLDFGAARAWSADADEAHTVVFTPGYAPLEQLATVARRSPATDVYGLSATLYASLAARPPEDATARAAGTPLTPLAELRPDIDIEIAEAIERGLALRPADRPATMAELRKLFEDGPGHDALDTLETLDDLLVRSRRFAFDRRACPACGGVLEPVRPLAKLTCPVCRRGRVQRRLLDPRLCPACRHGVIRVEKADTGSCGQCGGEVRFGRTLLGRRRGKCAGCGEVTDAPTVVACDTCRVRYVELPDGRRRNETTGETHYPEEWAKLAAGFDATAGNAECDACQAEYSLDGDRLTLVSAIEDTHGYADRYLGRPLPLERVRWLAVGKQSPRPGLVCERCATEFDRERDGLRLVDSPNRRLDRCADEIRPLESWHRLAEGLPQPGQEKELEERISHALAAAYRRGEVGFGDLAWKGPVEHQGRTTYLVARDDGLRLGRGLRTKTVPLSNLTNLHAEGDWLLAEGPDGPFELKIEPVELVGHLRSGDRSVVLTALDLAARLTWPILAGQAFRTR